MNLKPYNNYKNADVEWLGDIPEHWEVKRVKNLGNLQNGVSKGKDYFGFGYPFVNYGNVYHDTIVLKELKGLANSSEHEQKLYSVIEGDVFFTRTSETIQEIGMSGTALSTIPKATFSGFVIRLRPNKKLIYKGFSKYYFKAHISRFFLRKEISLVTRASLGQGILSNLTILLPPLTEQTKIANYLDQKTTAIDKKIKLLKAKIKHYEALKKSVINETVCRGLDKSAPMKDSGVEWIGEIPKHWEVKRIKDVFHIKKHIVGKNSSKYTLLSLTLNGVIQRDLENSKGKFPAKFDTYQIVDKKDLIFCLFDMDVTPRTIGFSSFDGMITGAYTIIDNQIDLEKKYYNYLFLSADIGKKLQRYYTGLRSTIRKDKFLSISVSFPPKPEQIEIANYLDKKTGTIDSIVKNVKMQIERLEELRKVLINDVVTGKVEIN